SSAAVRRSNESLGLLDPVRPESGDPSKTLGWRTEDLRDEAITTPKVADAAIATSKLVDGGVTTAKLGDGAVTTDKIGDSSVTRSKLAPSERFRWIMKTTNVANAVGRTSSPDYEIVRVGVGNYRADFNTPIIACSWSGTLAVDTGLPAAVTVRTAVDAINNERVFVQTLNAAGAPIDSGWSVQLFCGSSTCGDRVADPVAVQNRRAPPPGWHGDGMNLITVSSGQPAAHAPHLAPRGVPGRHLRPAAPAGRVGRYRRRVPHRLTAAGRWRLALRPGPALG
ncbi:MAG: hypothetical protein RJQ03_03920, partial [Miltoncostaeaceae bacterium]